MGRILQKILHPKRHQNSLDLVKGILLGDWFGLGGREGSDLPGPGNDLGLLEGFPLGDGRLRPGPGSGSGRPPPEGIGAV
jgi:hypothetical protein